MFVMFTPYSFLFFTLYLFFTFSLFTISNFYYYWMVMELIMLLFMGLSYTLFVSSYTQLMMYFLVQALSSFFILLSYMYDSSSFLTISIFMKLSMFPFHSWYINLVYRFPNFIMWLSSTVHKLPVMLMLVTFHLNLNMALLWVSILLTVLISGVMMLSLIDFRMLLVVSSVGNNSWFLLSQMSSLLVFFVFFIIYSFCFYMVLSSFKGMSKFSSISTSVPSSYGLSFWLLSLSGMPPFPVFYGKMLIMLTLISTYGYNHFMFLFMVFSSLMLMGYLQSLMKYFIYVYSNVSYYLLKY